MIIATSTFKFIVLFVLLFRKMFTDPVNCVPVIVQTVSVTAPKTVQFAEIDVTDVWYELKSMSRDT